MRERALSLCAVALSLSLSCSPFRADVQDLLSVLRTRSWTSTCAPYPEYSRANLTTSPYKSEGEVDLADCTLTAFGKKGARKQHFSCSKNPPHDPSTQGPSWGYFKSQFLTGLSSFGDCSPQNGSKTVPKSQNRPLGYPHIGPFVDPVRCRVPGYYESCSERVRVFQLEKCCCIGSGGYREPWCQLLTSHDSG